MSMYWTKRRIIDAIRAWEMEHGRPPKWNDWRTATPWTPSAQTVATRFGSWSFALRLAGYEAGQRQAWWTRRRILLAIRVWTMRHGGMAPSWNQWANAQPEYPAASTVQAAFGTWAKALEAAGLGHCLHQKRRAA